MICTLTLHPAVDRVLRVEGLPGGRGLVRSELVALLAAGKGFNVSRDLAVRGHRSIAAGVVGRPELGFYESSFGELGVELLLEAIPAPTRCNITLLSADSGGELHLRERGREVPAGALVSLAERMSQRLGPADTVAACGSLPGLDAAGLASALRLFRGRGARVLLDSSGEALGPAVRGAADVLKVNADELGEIVGSVPQTVEHAVGAAREVLGECPGRVLVTLGQAGAVAVSGEGAWKAAAPRVEAVNTVGAGDAFTAGFLSAEGKGTPEALRVAVAWGAAQAASGHIGLLEAERVEGLEAQATVSEA